MAATEEENLARTNALVTVYRRGIKAAISKAAVNGILAGESSREHQLASLTAVYDVAYEFSLVLSGDYDKATTLAVGALKILEGEAREAGDLDGAYAWLAVAWTVGGAGAYLLEVSANTNRGRV